VRTPLTRAAALLALSPSLALAQQKQDKQEPTYAAGPAAPANKPAEQRDSLPVVVYSVNRAAERPFETARSVTVITSDDIRRRNPRNLMDLLLESGVFMHQSAYGTNMVPFVRGFDGKGVLILVDGVPVNDAMQRYDANLIDVNMVERVEIVRGVGSVLGSEALGGTINVITKHGPARGETGAVHAFLSSRYAGNGAQAATGRAELYGRTERLQYRGGFSYQDNGDLRAGKGAGLLTPTAFIERGGNAHLDWYVTGDKTLSVDGRQRELVDPPRYDRYADGSSLQWLEPKADRVGSVRFEDLADRRFWSALRVTGYAHRREEGQTRIATNRPTVYSETPSVGSTTGANLEMASYVGAHSFVYGLDVSTERIHSIRRDSNMTTGVVTTSRGLYTDNSTYATQAAYVQDRMAFGRFVPTLGLRWSRFDSKGYENTSAGEFDITGSNAAVTATANALFKASRSVNLAAGVTSGFRAPNIEDLATLDQRGLGYEIPNPGVKPERITTYEAGVKVARPKLSANLFYQYSLVTDVMKRAVSGTYKGLDFFDLNGNGVRDANEQLIVQKVNFGESRFTGPELDVRYAPVPTVSLAANYQLVIGRDTKNDTYLYRIPPAFGAASARWSPAVSHQPWAELVFNYAAAQHRLGPDDLADVRIGADGTAGIDVLSLRSGVELMPKLTLRLAVENLANRLYAYNGSGIYRPGREVVGGLQYQY